MTQPLLPSQISAALQRQQNFRQRIANQAPQLYSQSGKALVTNNGVSSECVVTVEFVHPFTEEPTFTFGGVMDVRQQIVNGSFPTISAVVQGWGTAKDGGSLAYTGATVAIVTTGLDGQKMWVHYRFEGYALSFVVPG